MKRRCLNPNFKHYDYYGGRGVTICDRWLEFTNFLADMGECPEGLTLDRIENNGNYEPGNCRWATRKEQSRNIRTNRMFEFRGQSMTVAEISEITGVHRNTLWKRIDINGWEPKRAFTTPVQIQVRDRLHDFRGEKLTLLAISKRTGIDVQTLRSRLSLYGWPSAKAFNTPVKRIIAA